MSHAKKSAAPVEDLPTQQEVDTIVAAAADGDEGAQMLLDATKAGAEAGDKFLQEVEREVENSTVVGGLGDDLNDGDEPDMQDAA